MRLGHAIQPLSFAGWETVQVVGSFGRSKSAVLLSESKHSSGVLCVVGAGHVGNVLAFNIEYSYVFLFSGQNQLHDV